METLNPLLWSEGAQRLLAVAPRGLIASLLLPAFAPRLVPAVARAGIVLALVAVAALGSVGQQAVALYGSTAPLMLLLVKEAVIGVCLGLAFGLVFWVGSAIGELIDHQSGLTFSQNIDQQHGQSVSVTGRLIDQTVIAYFVASGGLLVFADTLLLSYELWPVHAWLPELRQPAMLLAAEESSRLLALTLLLAGPVLLVLLMVDLGFGLLGRSAPQINVFDLSIPVKTAVAMVVLMLALPFVLATLYDAFEAARSLLLNLMRG